MYEDFFGFDRRPFSLTPDREFLFWTVNHRRAFDMVCMSLLRQAPIALVTGDIGTGKTTLIRELLQEVSSDFEVALLSNVVGDGGDLLRWILTAFGDAARPATHADAVRQAEAVVRERWQSGRRSVVIVDEAQNLSDDGIETLRLLTNLDTGKAAPLSLVLIGQPELRDRLQEERFVAFRQRLGASCHLGPMTSEETGGYVRRRLEIAGGRPDVFSEDAIAAVYQRARGIPRLTNLLCDICLVAAYAEDRREVDGSFAEAALAEVLSLGGLGGLPAEGAGDAGERPVACRNSNPSQPTPFYTAAASVERSKIVPMSPVSPSHAEPLRLERQIGPATSEVTAESLVTERSSGRGGRIVRRAVGSAAGLAVAASVAAAALVLPAGPTDSRQAGVMTITSAKPVASGHSDPLRAIDGRSVQTAALAPTDPEAATALYHRALQASSGSEAALIDYARAAARGHGRAAYYLAQLYETGDGVGFAPSTASAWYEVAADEVPAALAGLQNLDGIASAGGDYALPRYAGVEAGAVELVWEGRGTFLVELAANADAAPSAQLTTALTAVRLKAPEGAGVWRVRAVGSAPSAWMPIGVKTDTVADVSSR